MKYAPLMLMVAGLAGCLSSGAPQQTDTPVDHAQAIQPFLANLTGFGPSFIHEMDGGGQGIWIHEDILYWTNGGDLVLADVSNATHPVTLGTLPGVGARDVDVLEWNGRTYAVLAGSGRGVHIVDATNPERPSLVTTVPLPSAGVHNLAAVPGTPYIYSSGASGQTKRIDVLDISDVDNPTVHTFPIPATIGGVPVESDGCHDITVRVDLERAYCAGGGGTYTGLGGETFIWDISQAAGGPTNPTWVSMMDDARIKYHHQALANADGTILIVDDEHIIANNCVHQDTPLPGALDPQVPTGAAWVWDISDEANPVLRSFVQNPDTFEEESGDPRVNCGSHFGDIILGQQAFVMGWYTGGTLMVSFEDPDNPEILDIEPAAGSTWDARYYNGHIFHAGGDLVVTQLV